MTDAITTETAKMVMWRNAVKKEQDAARAHVENWGFLHEKPDEAGKKAKPFATRPTKYYSNGATVVMKRLPMLPQDKVAADASQAPDVEELISTRTYRTVMPQKGVHTQRGPLSALDSTLHSHASRLDTIRGTDPFLHTTSQTYGSRLAIEQFGVTGYGRVDSSITNWGKREFEY